ncbi:MAG TPA: MFS transporter [Mycobacteriales bacterium]|nr:MFS transporter [Mycobacteriales bacterium]
MTAATVAVARPRSVSSGVVLATLSAAAFMASLDLFIVNVAFAAIGSDFRGESLGNLSWILNGYAVLYAALLVPLGRLADRYGRKAGFLAGLALFTLASAACAASPNLWSLVAFRGVQAVGAAALTPTSLGLLLAATPDRDKVKAVRIWAAIGALAAAFGPAVGGLLVQVDWRWVFLVNLPVGVAGWLAARQWVPDSRDASVERVPDLVGSAYLAVGVGALALALVKGPDWGWTSAADAVAFVVAIMATAAFWLRSGSHALPVIELSLLRVRAFAWSNATAVLFNVGFGAGLLGLVLWLQEVWHYSAIRTGLAIAPGPLMVPVFAAVAQRLAKRVSPGVLAATGCLLFAAGTLIVSQSVGPHPSYASAALPGWIVGGIGVGFAFPTIMSAATADLPASRASTGSAVVSMSRQIGLVLGISMFVAVLGAPVGYVATHQAFQHAWWVIAAATASAAVTAIGMTPRGRVRD